VQISPEQFSSHLRSGLKSVYLIAGDEPLLNQECADDLRLALRNQGFTAREVLQVATGFDWNDLFQSSVNLSLFAEKTWTELRIANGKPGKAGSEALLQYLKNPNPDQPLLVLCDQLEANIYQSAWMKAIEKAGVLVRSRLFPREQLPRWIAARAQEKKLKLTADAIQLLADHGEGNLLAVVQELEKLTLLYPDSNPNSNQAVDATQLAQLIASNARYNLFVFVDDLLKGERDRIAPTLDGLRGEGFDPPLLIWALAKDIRILLKIAYGLQSGQKMDALLAKERVWSNRTGLVRTAVKRHSIQSLEYFLQQLAHIDRCVKGIERGEVWQELLQLSLEFAGVSKSPW